jgi:hypothetical protein
MVQSIVQACTVIPCPAHQSLRSSSPTNLLWEFDLNLIHFVHGCFTILTLTMAKALSKLLAKEIRLKSVFFIGVGSVVCWPLLRNQDVPFLFLVSIANTTHRFENYFAKFSEKLADFLARRAARGCGTRHPPKGSVVAATSVSASSSSLLDLMTRLILYRIVA